MSVTIPARSPLLQYSPCVDCFTAGGWASKGDQMEGRDGRLSIGFNFTGTSLSYRFPTKPSSDWRPILTVNGTETANASSPYELSDLPQGSHTVQLALIPPQPDPFANQTISPFTFSGITFDTGMIGTSARNVTIDDTAWRNGSILLSPGWNMMESEQGGAQSNWINDTQIEQEQQTRGQNYNDSLSWTEQRRANTTILFEGEQIWVYGLSGGEAGRYEVLVDGAVKGRFDAAGGPRVYGSLLYTSNLPSGRHDLTLSNLDEGRRLSFDRLVTVSGLTPAPRSPPAPTPSPSSTSAAQNSESPGLSPGAVGGIVLGVLVGLATLIPLFLFILRQRNKRRGNDLHIEKDGSGSDTFFKWPNASKKDTEGSWFRLPDRNVSPNPGASTPGSNPEAGFSLGSTTRDPNETDRSLFKIPSALRKSGTWSFGQGAQSERSFMSDLGSPSSATTPHASRFRGTAAPDKRAGSSSSFFSFNNKGAKGKPDFTISNPIPMASGDVTEDNMTPAMSAAVSGRTMSPLAQIKNHALAGPDAKLMPIGLGTNMAVGTAQEQRKVGTAI